MDGRQSVPFLAFLTSMILATAKAKDPKFCADRDNGLYADPMDCNKYYNCFGKNTYSQNCPLTLQFNPKSSTCDWEYNVRCSDRSIESQMSLKLTSPLTTEKSSRPLTEGILLSTLALKKTTAASETAKFTSAVSDLANPNREVIDSPSTARSTTTTTTTKATKIPTTEIPRTTQQQAVATTGDSLQILGLTAPTKTTTQPTQQLGITTETTKVTSQKSLLPLLGTTTPAKPTSAPKPSTTFCRNRVDGFYPDPYNCSSFYRCYQSNTYYFTCGWGLMYSMKNEYCDWPRQVNCSATDRKQPEINSPEEDFEILYFQNGTTQETVVAAPGSAEGCNRVVCYYPNWAIYRMGEGAFGPEEINTNLCTHIVFAFVTIKNNTLAAIDLEDEPSGNSIGHFARVTNLKQKNPKLKIILAVGGWSVGSQPFTQMAATRESRSEFVNSTIPFLRKRNFDGLDFDWEYPANRGSPPSDKEHYASLCEELRAAFDAETSGSDRLLLTTAGAAGKAIIDTAYDVPRITKALDFINLMTYDLHGSWDSVTGHNSPLKKGSWENSWQSNFNVEWVVNYWVSLGAPKSKLVIGMPLYGRSFRLSTSDVRVGAPSNGPGTPGPYTQESGILTYYEVCLQFPGSERYFIDSQRVPFLVSGDQWIGYDDASSLREKVRFAKNNGFGGVMVWDLSHDDFSGQFCRQGQNPLLNAINDECSQ